MVKKKEISKEIKAVKLKVQEGKAIIGTERVLKELKKGRLSKVILAKNCPEKSRRDINYYAQLVKIPVAELEQDNEELGVLCKKNYFVSVLGIKE